MSQDHSGQEPFASLEDLNAIQPDPDYPSTVSNLWGCGATEHLRCWRAVSIRVADIDPYQLHDDPNALDSIAKIQSIPAHHPGGHAAASSGHAPLDGVPLYPSFQFTPSGGIRPELAPVLTLLGGVDRWS